MTSKPRGLVVIINNFVHRFSEEHELRMGTKSDEKGLKRLFEVLHFKVEVHTDKTENVSRKYITCQLHHCQWCPTSFPCDLTKTGHTIDCYVAFLTIENMNLMISTPLINIDVSLYCVKGNIFIHIYV